MLDFMKRGAIYSLKSSKSAIVIIPLIDIRVLARNFKTCVPDSLLGIIWRPKICVQVSEYDESSWSYETHAASIATSEFEIRYSLSKLTKRSDKLF